MFDFIRKLFGKGKLRFEGTTTDGQSYAIKIKYTGDIRTLDMEECRRKVRQALAIEKGVIMDTCVYKGYMEE